MKVLLVTAAGAQGGERWMPLGLLYLASTLQQHGHEVKLCDRQLAAMRGGRAGADAAMLESVSAFRPDLVGFNTVSPLIYDTAHAVRLLRDSGYAGTILLGGHHATALPELTLRRITGADGTISGEGEAALAAYADGCVPKDVPALAYRDGERILHNPVQEACALDSLPLPAYGLLDQWYTGRNAYTIRGHHLKAGSALGSRGCMNRCAFCAESLTYARGVRFHSAEYVAENVALLHREHGCDGVVFFDNDFLASRAHFEETLLALIRRGLHRRVRLCVQARTGRFDADAAKLLKEAGCVKVEFGFETADASALSGMGKNEGVEAAERAASLCREHGIGLQANMIAGLPGDNPAAVDATMRWLVGIGAENVKWGPLMLLPGTRLYEEQGGRFFEENEWTEQAVTAYYARDHLSGRADGELSSAVRAALKPHARALHYSTLIRKNPVHRTLGYFIARLAEKAGGRYVGKRQGTKSLP